MYTIIDAENNVIGLNHGSGVAAKWWDSFLTYIANTPNTFSLESSHSHLQFTPMISVFL